MRHDSPMGIPLEDLASFGDPDGMESLASDLMLRAEAVAGIGQTLSRQVDSMGFEGPAAAVLREHTSDRRRRAEEVAAELHGLAEILKGRAAEAREDIYQARAAQRREREQGP